MQKHILAAMQRDLSALDEVPDLVCYDHYMNVVTKAQLEAWYGGHTIDVQRCEPDPDAPYIVRVVSLRGHDTGAVQLVRTVDPAGLPVPGVAVARWWPSAPAINPYPGDCQASRWRDNAVIGWTKENGDVGFGMGKGDCPPGFSGVWVLHCDAPSDWVGGLGWDPGTGDEGGGGHKVIDVTFAIFPYEGDDDDDDDDEEPGPIDPTDPSLSGLLTDLEEIGALGLAAHAFARGALAIVQDLIEGGGE